MGAKRTKTSQDYFEFLKEVYNKITNGEKILLQPLTRECGVATITSSIMISGGLIKNIGSKKFPKYTWETCIPNVKMAEKLFEEVNKYNKKYQDKYRENKKEESNPTCVVWDKQHIPSIGSEVADLQALLENESLKEEEAILLLKNLGYKIMKPVTQWEEI